MSPLSRGGGGPRVGPAPPLHLRRRLVGQGGCRVRLQEPSGSSADKGRGNFLVWAGEAAEAGVWRGWRGAEVARASGRELSSRALVSQVALLSVGPSRQP